MAGEGGKRAYWFTHMGVNVVNGNLHLVKSLNTHGIGLVNTNREGTKRYFHFDGLGSTRALTDGSENITDTYDFSAYGVLESSTGSSVNPFRYVRQWGYYDDGARGSVFGLTLLGVRYYDKSSGRFLVWDSFTFLNAYLYAANMPQVAVDPSGLYAIAFQDCDESQKRLLMKALNGICAQTKAIQRILFCLRDYECSRGGVGDDQATSGCIKAICAGLHGMVFRCRKGGGAKSATTDDKVITFYDRMFTGQGIDHFLCVMIHELIHYCNPGLSHKAIQGAYNCILEGHKLCRQSAFAND